MNSSPLEDSENLRPLVQAPMDSPLNRAHQFSRKADMLTRSRKFEEAMGCHSKAAECILMAMETCSSQSMLDSLALQHKSYLSELDRLCEKAKLFDMLSDSAYITQTGNQSTQTDDVENISGMKVADEGDIFQVLRESKDFLKEYLVPQEKEHAGEASAMSDKSYKSISLCESDSNSSDGLGSEKSNNEWKMVNSVDLSNGTNPLKFQEALALNKRLTMCVTDLIEELSLLKDEKKKIEERFCSTDDALTPLAEPALTFTSLSFPPLESLYPEVGNFSPPK